MKKTFRLLLPGAALLLLTAFCFAEDILARLGLEERTARYFVLSNLAGSFSESPTGESEQDEENSNDPYYQTLSFRIPYARLLPSVITGDKAGAARELCAYVKMYVNSADFMEDYTKRREAAKPTSEPWRPDAEMIEGQRKSVKEMEKQLADMKKQKGISPSVISSFEKSIQEQKASLAQWEDPTPNKTRWEKKYPADPSGIIKKRLEEYLALSATVDFSAQLTPADKYGKKKFMNPEYEKKSNKWKACYRAGKEVNDVVTAFVREWLKGPVLTAQKEKMPATETAGNKTRETVKDKQPAPENNTDSIAKPVKEKKNLLNKLKKVSGF